MVSPGDVARTVRAADIAHLDAGKAYPDLSTLHGVTVTKPRSGAEATNTPGPYVVDGTGEHITVFVGVEGDRKPIPFL